MEISGQPFVKTEFEPVPPQPSEVTPSTLYVLTHVRNRNRADLHLYQHIDLDPSYCLPMLIEGYVPKSL